MTDREKLRALVEKWRTEKNNTADDPVERMSEHCLMRVAAAFNAGLQIAAMELESALATPAPAGEPESCRKYSLSEEIGPTLGHWVCECGEDLGDCPIDEIDEVFAEHQKQVMNALVNKLLRAAKSLRDYYVCNRLNDAAEFVAWVTPRHANEMTLAERKRDKCWKRWDALSEAIEALSRREKGGK